MRIRLYPTPEQKAILNEWMNTCNYVYNKTIETINNGAKIHFQSLRDRLVTSKTKKTDARYIQIAADIKQLHANKKLDLKETKDKDVHEKIETRYGRLITQKKRELSDLRKLIPATSNEGINEWELQTPKEIRAGSVNDVCKAYTTAYANLRKGNIFGFSMGFRKHGEDKSIVLQKNLVRVEDGVVHIAPKFTGGKCALKMKSRTARKHGNIRITRDTRMLRERGEYWLLAAIDARDSSAKRTQPQTCCGVDPGVKMFMTVVGTNGVREYHKNTKLLDALNKKLRILKQGRALPKRKGVRRCARKSKFLRLEQRKANLVDELHWNTIHSMLSEHDAIFYGDIKSHAIVKKSRKHKLNQDVTDLKFYQFKTRLLYKAEQSGKLVVVTPEPLTTKTCSQCGVLNEVGLSRVYECDLCNARLGRDINSGLNMLIRGLVHHI